jgi:hypothetical protein
VGALQSFRRSPWLLACVVAIAAAACGFEPSFDETRYRCGGSDSCPSGFRCLRGFCESGLGASGDAGISPSIVPDPEPDPTPDASDVGIDAGVATDARAIDAGGGGTPIDAGVVATFQDAFDDGVLTGWAPWVHPGCTAIETGGFLELGYDGTGDGYCGADSSRRFDLRGSAVSVEVVAAPLLANFESYVVLFNNQQQLVMVRGQDGLTMQLKNNGTMVSQRTVANDLTAQRFWRIREQAGTIFWETSPDGATWTRRHSAPSSFDVSSLVVELAAGHYSPGPGVPVVVHFDHLVVL